ncbi:MAG TPA: phosphatase PAP2 family protein [Polyangiaceae bacterium]|nr:phosphatase PAP2 family protein [Polyangiaceae bacterium]
MTFGATRIRRFVGGWRAEEVGAVASVLVLLCCRILLSATIRWNTYFTTRGAAIFAFIATFYVLGGSRSVGAKCRPYQRALQFLRDWGPFVVLIAVYENLLPLIRVFRPHLYDAQMLRWDLYMLGTTPSVWLVPLASRTRTEWFSACYLALFALPLISGGVLYLSGRMREFRQFLRTFVLAGAMGYLGYVAVPVVGPRYFFPELFPGRGVEGGSFSALTDHVSHPAQIASSVVPNCFPSLHTAWGIIVLIFAYRQCRWLFWFYLIPVTSLIFATLYLRFHYAVDVIAGATLGIGLSVAVPWLEARYANGATAGLRITPARTGPQGTPRGARSEGVRLLLSAAARLKPTRAFVALLAVVPWIYASSLANGLTLKNRAQDGAELVTAAITSGTAHPPGYPLYLMLVRAACWFWAGAAPINVAHASSAVFCTIAGLLVCAIVRKVLAAIAPDVNDAARDLAGVCAGGLFCLSRTVLGVALVAEVYALHAALVAGMSLCAVNLLVTSEREVSRGTAVSFGLLGGLAISHHLTALPVFAVQCLILWRSRGTSRNDLRVFLPWVAGCCLGLLPWLYLPWAASREPVVSWGQPSTLASFWWVVSAAQYHARLGGTPSELWKRLIEYGPFQALPASALALAWLGLACLYRTWLNSRGRVRGSRQDALTACRPRLAVIALLAGSGAVNLVLCLFYDIPDLGNYFIPALLGLTILAGVGCSELMRALRELRGTRGAAFEIVSCLVGATVWWTAVSNLRQTDAQGGTRFDQRVRTIVRQAAPSSLIAARGDGMVFGLWYEKFVRQPRHDVDVVSRELLLQAWYPRQSRHFSERMRWPAERLQGDPDRRLAAVIRENWAHRPVVVIDEKDVPSGCVRAQNWVVRCEGSAMP